MNELAPVEIDDPVILIKINRTYRKDMTLHQLYDATRSAWIVNPERSQKAKYALAVYEGVVVGVFEITGWHPSGTTMRLDFPDGRKHSDPTKHPAPGRWEFVGLRAPEDIVNKYLDTSVGDSGQNPIRYVNVD